MDLNSLAEVLDAESHWCEQSKHFLPSNAGFENIVSGAAERLVRKRNSQKLQIQQAKNKSSTPPTASSTTATPCCYSESRTTKISSSHTMATTFC
jgi:hypothetical protein